MMALRRSPAAVIFPDEILYNCRCIQLDAIGMATFSAMMSFVASGQDHVITGKSLRTKGLTDVAPYGQRIHYIVCPDDTVDEGYQARQACPGDVQGNAHIASYRTDEYPGVR